MDGLPEEIEQLKAALRETSRENRELRLKLDSVRISTIQEGLKKLRRLTA